MNVIPSTDSSDVITARAGSLAPCASMGACDTKARNRTDPASLGCIWLPPIVAPGPRPRAIFRALSLGRRGLAGQVSRHNYASQTVVRHPGKAKTSVHIKALATCSSGHWCWVRRRSSVPWSGRVRQANHRGRAAGGQFLDAAGRTDRARRHWRWRWRCRWSAKSNPSRRPYAR